MVKIKCKICGDTGYTAAPRSLVCKCGGRFKVIPETKEEELVVIGGNTSSLFNFSNLLNYGNS